MVSDPAFRCSPDHDNILVDGKTVRKKELVYIVMNKPVGVVTTRSDERGSETVYDILGDVGRWVFPVGRLDKDTSGLLFFTNDNQFGETLTNPASQVPKTYRVRLNNPFDRDDIDIVRQGMLLDGERLLPAEAIRFQGPQDEYWIQMTIVEGKNRQIRRMCGALGYTVLELRRTRIGPIEVEDLSVGKWKYLTKQEVLALANLESNPTARKLPSFAALHREYQLGTRT